MNPDPWIERKGFNQQSASHAALCAELARVRCEVSEAIEVLQAINYQVELAMIAGDLPRDFPNGSLGSALKHLGEHLQWALDPATDSGPAG